jgi:hypothetical protein
MSVENAINQLISLRDLKGKYIVPKYQRGYRWTIEEVNDLLLDLKAFVDNFNEARNIYFLQTLVVKPLTKAHDTFELVDGQQRLVTSYLIDATLCAIGKHKSDLHYSIECEDRVDSNILLELLKDNPNMDITPEINNEIDLYHLLKASGKIWDYFTQFRKNTDFLKNFYSKFTNNIHFFVEKSTDKDTTNHFRHLGMGKIPLRSSELCRALLLNPANHNLDKEFNLPLEGMINHDNDFQRIELAKTQSLQSRQTLLGANWDAMERHLRNPDLWSFLTTEKFMESHAGMDFLLDLYTEKPINSTDELYAFHALENKLQDIKHLDAQVVWDDITSSFSKLYDWYENNDLYHWIGYLIRFGKKDKCTLMELFKRAKNVKKSQFMREIKDLIKESVKDGYIHQHKHLPMETAKKTGKDTHKSLTIDDLNYEDHHDLIKQILFLFSVEYIRKLQRDNLTGVNGDYAQYFPFSLYSNKSEWSLEHIEPQNAELLSNEEDWIMWIEERQIALREMQHYARNLLHHEHEEEIVSQIKLIYNECEIFLKNLNFQKHYSQNKFLELSRKVIDVINTFEVHAKTNTHKFRFNKHGLGNLALLQADQNRNLKNYVFYVKQKILIESIKQGDYIPKTTELLFLRYFSDVKHNLPYWSLQDYEGYINEIKTTLGSFLPENFKEE